MQRTQVSEIGLYIVFTQMSLFKYAKNIQTGQALLLKGKFIYKKKTILKMDRDVLGYKIDLGGGDIWAEMTRFLTGLRWILHF